MGGVIFVIGTAFPEHWQRAQQAGFWESERHLNVVRGDLLVFWQAGQREFLGVGVATGPTEPVDYSIQSRPWLDSDKTDYVFRYRMVLIAGTGDPRIKWPALMELVGQNPRRGANTAPVSFDDGGADRLVAHFGLRSTQLDVSRGTASRGESLVRELLDSPRPIFQSDVPYRTASEDMATKRGVVFDRDPDAVDRGLNEHNRTQNAAANWLAAHRIEVHSPQGAVNYDLAWEHDHVKYVGEVKSLHPLNERNQIRLGIGQVLEFAFRSNARPVLILERKPEADYWKQLCDHLGIILTWPSDFDRLIPEGDD